MSLWSEKSLCDLSDPQVTRTGPACGARIFFKSLEAATERSRSIATHHWLENVAYLIVLGWGIAESQPLLVPLCLAGLLAFLMAPLVRFFASH